MTRFEKAIDLHKRHARISFKEMKETDIELFVRVSQTRNPNGNHATKERLEDIARELYALKPDFNKKLVIHAVPYVEAPSEIVTPDWILKKMHEHGIGVKGLVQDLGFSKSDISATINGHKEMGIRTKGLFYYYFLSKDLGKQFYEFLQTSGYFKELSKTYDGAQKDMEDFLSFVKDTLNNKDNVHGDLKKRSKK